MNKIKRHLLPYGIFMAFCLISTTGFGQTASVSLDSVFVTISAPGDDTQVLVAQQALNDTAATGDWVQLNVRIDLSDADEIGSIKIEYGSQQGASDILLMELQCIPINGSPFLMHGNTVFPFSGNRVLIDRLIPTSTLLNQGFLKITGKDKNGVDTNVLVQNNIG